MGVTAYKRAGLFLLFAITLFAANETFVVFDFDPFKWHDYNKSPLKTISNEEGLFSHIQIYKNITGHAPRDLTEMRNLAGYELVRDLIFYRDPITGQNGKWIYFPDAVDAGDSKKVALAMPWALFDARPWRRGGGIRIITFGNGETKVFGEKRIPQDIRAQLDLSQSGH
jgi:hypothetical protein